jgi:hypothetical protein
MAAGNEAKGGKKNEAQNSGKPPPLKVPGPRPVEGFFARIKKQLGRALSWLLRSDGDERPS